MIKNILLFALAAFSLTITGNLYGQDLNPGDGIRITFLDITDNISGDYFIQPGDKLQLPYAGIFTTKGKKFDDIKSEIISRYDSLYRDPDLTVLALFRINIHGEVRNPGFYYVTETENLTGIMALAGGYTNAADLDDIYIVRDGKEIELDIETLIEEENTAAEIGLRSGDQIVIPRSFWADSGQFAWIISLIAVIITAVALFVR